MDVIYKADIPQYIDLPIAEKVKAKDYKESLEKVSYELKLERQTKVKTNQALITLEMRVGVYASFGAVYLG